jgi:hypothetical protein
VAGHAELGGQIRPGMRVVPTCQARPKRALDLHWAEPAARSMEKLFVDFVGPLVRNRRGNITILVVVDAFSKSVNFYPVRRIIAQVMLDCLELGFFRRMGRLSTR